MSRNINACYSKESDKWYTPQELFDELDKEFHFTLDPCATAESAKCDLYFTIQNDGLQENWGGA